jgi:hypothetical protein
VPLAAGPGALRVGPARPQVTFAIALTAVLILGAAADGARTGGASDFYAAMPPTLDLTFPRPRGGSAIART